MSIDAADAGQGEQSVTWHLSPGQLGPFRAVIAHCTGLNSCSSVWEGMA